LVNTLGNGLFYTSSALFLTRSVGLSVSQVGIGLTIAGIVGLLANVPAGRIAEIYGPREVLAIATALAGVCMAGYGLVHSFGMFLVVACAYLVTYNASNAVRNGLIATAVDSNDRVRTRAYLRSITNLGIGVGSALAGIALHIDTRDAYLTLIYGNAISFVATVALVMRLPHVPPLPKIVGDGPQLVAIRDRPFLSVVALNSLLCIHNSLVEIAVPLWIVRHTNAPRVMVAVVFVFNTSMCVLFQVRASKGVDDIRSSSRALRQAGLLLLASCALYAAAGGRSEWVAIVVLLLAELAHVTGELLQSAGSWGYGYGLAPEALQGQYQGLFSMNYAVSGMLGPVVVTAVAIGWGWPGWLVIGGAFAGLGFALGPVGRWAAANRPTPVEFAELNG
jgi:predicted MFS family arabinose efflux permease